MFYVCSSLMNNNEAKRKGTTTVELFYDPKEQDGILDARESFSGRLLSNALFDEFMVLTHIVERRIKTEGAFKDVLQDYSYAIARSSNMDPARAETIVRDLFKIRTGQTMNQMREGLAERESKLTRAQTGMAYDFALATGKMIEEGNKISFNRAFSHQAAQLASELKITDACAKRLMKEEFKAAEADLDFVEWGKDIEARFYRPQIEAERQKSQDRSRDDGRNPESDRPHNGAGDAKPRSRWRTNGSESNGPRHSTPGPRR